MPPVTTTSQSRPRAGSRHVPAGTRLAPAALALAAAAALAGCGGGTNVSWAIVGSGPGGDTLIVAPLTAVRSCDGKPKAELNKSNANRIDLGVTVEQGDCSDEGARPAGLLAVELAQPLRGQQITGKGLRPPSAYPGAKTAKTVPSVVGFRVPDARAIAEAHGLEIGDIFGPAVDATEVTTQSPPAGAPLPTSPSSATPKVSLRTVPR